ncbi:hypothetical protein SLA2020_231630 [Shorea laevis]
MADNAKKVEAAAAVAEDKVAKQVVILEGSTNCKLLQLKHISDLLLMSTIVVSLPILALAMCLLYMEDYECEALLRLSRLQVGIGIGLVFIFLISNAALLLRSRLPMVGVMLVMVPLLMMLTIGLTFVGAYKMESKRITASPMWFKSKVYNNNKWSDIKSCIYKSETCEEMAITSMALSSYVLNMQKLTPIESGCCRPPTFCEMEAVNATFWVKKDHKSNRTHPYDADCDTWSNDQNILCYDCQSFREGFLSTVERKWRELGLFMVTMAVELIICHLSVFLGTMFDTLGS